MSLRFMSLRVVNVYEPEVNVYEPEGGKCL